MIGRISIMKQRLINFFSGRNGTDSISKTTLWVSILFLIVSIATAGVLNGILSTVFWLLALILIIYGYWRILSRNIYKRRAENDRFIAVTSGIRSFFRGIKVRVVQGRQYKFFKCPSCKTVLRVPRGKGRVQITCKKCGNRFSGKT